MKLKAVVHEAEEGRLLGRSAFDTGLRDARRDFEDLLHNLYEAVEGCLSVEMAKTPIH